MHNDQEHNWEDPHANESENESKSEESGEESNSTSAETDAGAGMTRRESLGIPSVQSTSSDADTTSSESGNSDSDSSPDSDANADGGLLANGLSAIDSRLVLGSMVPAYVLAGWLLWIAHLHGLHHAPPFLWWGIAALILLPVGLLFGPQILLENASSLMSRSGSDSSHTNRGK